MELEKQVCSLGLAKKLKELGVKQESWFWWNHVLEEDDADEWMLDDFNHGNGISAFTVAELGEMLPESFFTKKHLGSGTKKWHWQAYSTFEEGHINGELLYCQGCLSDTEADARAKMLIHLLENKLINL